ASDKDDDAPFLQMPDGAPADEGLRDLAHLDRRHQARGDAPFFQSILQRETVDHGRQQPHVVRRDPVDALRGGRYASDDVGAPRSPLVASRGGGSAWDDVAAPEHDRRPDAQRVHVTDFVGEPRHDVRREAEALVAHQRLPRELQENALIDGRLTHVSAKNGENPGSSTTHYAASPSAGRPRTSPSLKRTKRSWSASLPPRSTTT